MNTPAAYLPHRPPMLMLTDAGEVKESHITCEASIEPDNPLLQNGNFPGFACLELCAQAAGCLIGSRGGTAPKAAAIISVRSLHAAIVDIPAHSRLNVHARLLGGDAKAAMFEGEIDLSGEKIFNAMFTVAELEQVT